MSDRLDIPKTHKLFIAGQFPRSESGRSLPITRANAERTITHVSCASRKDLRNAVEAASAAFPKWSTMTAYNRGQILYRMAEMLEGRRAEFTDLIADHPATPRTSTKRAPSVAARKKPAVAEVEAAIDRLICFAGWADKYAQVLGASNPVAGPYYNFTVPEPTGIVGAIAPDALPLLGLISLIAPPLCAGNTIVALASQHSPLPAAVLGEVCSTSDVPPGVINILTGLRDELVPQFASHRDLGAIHAAGLSAPHEKILREGVADNLKRVTIRSAPAQRPRTRGTSGSRATSPVVADFDGCESPWWIEPFVEFKTVWHPSGA